MKIIIIEWDSGTKEYIEYSLISLEYIIQNFPFMKDLYIVEQDKDYARAVEAGKDKLAPASMDSIFQSSDIVPLLDADPISKSQVVCMQGAYFVICPDTGKHIPLFRGNAS